MPIRLSLPRRPSSTFKGEFPVKKKKRSKYHKKKGKGGKEKREYSPSGSGERKTKTRVEREKKLGGLGEASCTMGKRRVLKQEVRKPDSAEQ